MSGCASGYSSCPDGRCYLFTSNYGVPGCCLDSDCGGNNFVCALNANLNQAVCVDQTCVRKWEQSGTTCQGPNYACDSSGGCYAKSGSGPASITTTINTSISSTSSSSSSTPSSSQSSTTSTTSSTRSSQTLSSASANSSASSLPTSSGASSSLSTGAKAGIAIGVILGVLIIALLTLFCLVRSGCLPAFLCFKRKKKQKSHIDEISHSTNAPVTSVAAANQPSMSDVSMTHRHYSPGSSPAPHHAFMSPSEIGANSTTSRDAATMHADRAPYSEDAPSWHQGSIVHVASGYGGAQQPGYANNSFHEHQSQARSY